MNSALCRNRVNELYRAYLGQGMSDSDAVFYANLDLRQDYALCFYHGLVFGSLEEVYKP